MNDKDLACSFPFFPHPFSQDSGCRQQAPQGAGEGGGRRQARALRTAWATLAFTHCELSLGSLMDPHGSVRGRLSSGGLSCGRVL